MFENPSWQDVARFALLPGGLLLGLLVHLVLFHLLRRFTSGIEGAVVRHGCSPMRLLLPLIGLLLMLPLADLGSSTEQVVARTVGLAIIGCFGWLTIALMEVASDLIAEKYPISATDNLTARALRTRISVLRSAGVVVVTIITASVILMSFPSVRQLGVSLLASAGLLALVVGMAARPALENLIAGLQIALTQPIKLDDVVVIEGEWGRIEEITTTYVVVRIWDARRLILPLSYFITNPIENWTRKTSDILATVTVHTDYTVAVEEVRKELHTILQASPHWDGRTWGMQVTGSTDSSMELRALMSARDSSAAWDLRCEVRENLIQTIQKRWPESLPRVRTEADSPGTRAVAGEGA